MKNKLMLILASFVSFQAFSADVELLPAPLKGVAAEIAVMSEDDFELFLDKVKIDFGYESFDSKDSIESFEKLVVSEYANYVDGTRTAQHFTAILNYVRDVVLERNEYVKNGYTHALSLVENDVTVDQIDTVISTAGRVEDSVFDALMAKAQEKGITALSADELLKIHYNALYSDLRDLARHLQGKRIDWYNGFAVEVKNHLTGNRHVKLNITPSDVKSSLHRYIEAGGIITSELQQVVTLLKAASRKHVGALLKSRDTRRPLISDVFSLACEAMDLINRK